MDIFINALGVEPYKSFLNLMGAMIVAYITVQLALRRFKQERLWDRRLAVYSDLIEGLTEMLRVDEIWYEREESEAPDNEEYEQELRNRSKVARAKFESASALSRLMLGPEVVSVIDRYEQEREASKQLWRVSHIDLLESYGADIVSLRKAVTAILDIAKNMHKLG